MSKNNLIELGWFANTHGINGEIKVYSKFPREKELEKNRLIFIKNNEYKIISSRRHKKFILLKFEGINNINQIEKYKGEKILGELIMKSIPEYIGYDVIYNQEIIGKVIDYFKQGSIWSIVIRKLDNSLVNVPYIDKFILKNINNKIFIKEGEIL